MSIIKQALNENLTTKSNGAAPSSLIEGSPNGGVTSVPVKTTVTGELVIVGDATSPIPVNLVEANGTTINVTAGDIDIHLTDIGANYDSVRIGNGTNTLNINTDGSVNVANDLPTITTTSPTIKSYEHKAILAVDTQSATLITTDAAYGATQFSITNNTGATIEVTIDTQTIYASAGDSFTMPMRIGANKAISITPRNVGLTATDIVVLRIS